MTVWKEFPDTEYEVSDDGQVRRKGAASPLRPWVDRKGYELVNLHGSNYRIHRLVLRVHRREPENGEQARHLNGDPADNRVANLRWGTALENAADRKRHGGYDRALTHDQVQRAARLRAAGLTYRDIAEKFEVSKATIWRAIQDLDELPRLAGQDLVEQAVAAMGMRMNAESVVTWSNDGDVADGRVLRATAKFDGWMKIEWTFFRTVMAAPGPFRGAIVAEICRGILERLVSELRPELGLPEVH